jgi:hypothetical protein
MEKRRVIPQSAEPAKSCIWTVPGQYRFWYAGGDTQMQDDDSNALNSALFALLTAKFEDAAAFAVEGQDLRCGQSRHRPASNNRWPLRRQPIRSKST